MSAVKEHGLLFSAPMVRAQLPPDPIKDQTRRIVAFHNSITVPHIPRKLWQYLDLQGGVPGTTSCGVPYLTVGFKGYPSIEPVRIYPRIQPGHIIWVRETWAIGANALGCADEKDWPIIFKASGTDLMYSIDRKWRSPLHLKRMHTRLVRTVPAVGLQRVQEITPRDAWAEGVRCGCSHPVPQCAGNIAEFAELWEQVNGPGAWERNEWVWSYHMGGNIA